MLLMQKKLKKRRLVGRCLIEERRCIADENFERKEKGWGSESERER